MFVNCTKLEFLSVSFYYPLNNAPPHDPAVINQILNSNKRLTTFEIDHAEAFFNESFVPEISFKLATFMVNFHILQTLQVRLNFNTFLMTQKQTLEELRLRGWVINSEIDYDIMETISSMPHLKKLMLLLNNFGNMPLGMNLEENHSVVNLFLGACENSLGWAEYFMKTFCKVEYLVVEHVTDSVADLISRTCKSLKRLSTARFSATNISNEKFFSNLNELKSCTVDPNASQQLFERLNGELEFCIKF